MDSNRSLERGARQEEEFDPDTHEDPVSDLTLAIRHLRLGARIRLSNDTLVVSRTVQVGPHQERRFSVVPSLAQSSPQERHRAMALGHGACKSAEEAAKKALS